MSELTLTDLAAAPDTAPNGIGTTSAHARWGFWVTTAWGIGAFAAMCLLQLLAGIGVLLWWGVDETTMPTAAQFASNATIVSIGVLASLTACVAMLTPAVKLARVSVADYLALKRFDTGTLLLGLACTFGYLAAVDILTYVSGRPLSVPFVQEIYRTAIESGTLPLLLLGILVAAPVSEELFFRGFLLRGWAASRLGTAGAVVLTSAIWAVVHTQYDWITVGQIFGLGLLLGWLRLRSGSTVLTIVLHGAYSAGALVQAAILHG